MLGCGESTIGQWVMAYRARGIEGVRSGWKGDNTAKLTDEERTLVKERLQQYHPVDL